MERGGLPLEQRLIVGVAGDAATGLHAPDRGVAGVAVVFEEGMSLRQPPRTGGELPSVRVCQNGRLGGQAQQVQYEGEAPECGSRKQHEWVGPAEFLHANHLNPK